MIHLYRLNGFNIVIDINSGSIHVVDDLAYKIISLYKEEEKDINGKLMGEFPDITSKDIKETINDIEELKREGKLFSKDFFENMAPMMKKKQGVLKAICLHVAHDCNMDCQYCFAGKGEYHGEKGLMSLETGKRALEFLVANSGERKNLEVDFFGGEPLLNWDVCKALVEYGRDLEKKHNKNFRFTLTTNGILITNEIMEFLNKEMSNVVLSLDGNKETNDKMRKTKCGEGTYDLIIDKFKQLVDKREQKNYYLRGTYTKYNLDFAKDIIHMAELGFKELSMEPVVASPTAEYALDEKDLPQLMANYEKLALEMIDREKKGESFNFYHYAIDLKNGPCVSKRVSGCGVGTEYLAITPHGDIYPCHQFVGDREFLMGNLTDEKIDYEVLEEFEKSNVYSHDECKECFAKFYCSGGCAANAYHQTGNINGVYNFSCELHKKRIECAIMMKVALEL